jgi:septum formation protein
MDLVLASGSPRRRDLLESLGVEFAVDPPDVDEAPLPGEHPVDYVRRLSVDKAMAVAARHGDDVTVVAADTTVDVGGRILGKPESPDEARSMLLALSATTHQVHTGVTVRAGDRVETSVATTSVTFTTVTPELLEWYLATGEPFDKAGGYALQGAGALLVDAVNGSVSNVVGLPLTLLAELLAAVGLALVSPPGG